MATVELHSVSKQFGQVRAVSDVSLEVKQGEFLSLLGPSGCGKTTTLRLIAGFEPATAGRILLAGEDVTERPSYKRNIGMVFQNYALFPHMTVQENVAFGLRMRHVPKPDIESRVKRALTLVQLTGLDGRYPRQLSGGQQQRVAVARALVIEPQLLLLDEPLSNLDAKLREEMRIELKQIQQKVGITTIFVTHDQEEALTMSDRIVVMNSGEIVQQGTPVDVYERPAHSFVAGFIGQANLLWGKAAGRNNGHVNVATDSGLQFAVKSDGAFPEGSRVLAVVRHARVKISKNGEPQGPNSFPASIEFVTYLGSNIQYLCRSGATRLAASLPNEHGVPDYSPGAEVVISWRPEDCLLVAE